MKYGKGKKKGPQSKGGWVEWVELMGEAMFITDNQNIWHSKCQFLAAVQRKSSSEVLKTSRRPVLKMHVSLSAWQLVAEKCKL